MKYEIPYAPREWALALHDTDKRWNVIVAHRRCGKSVAAINHLIRDACKNKDSRYAFISPTYRQGKQIIWDYLKHYSMVIPGVKTNESELRVDFPNGARITLYGADNPDSLCGIALWGVVFDEYSQQPSNIFTEIIRPALADNKGYGIWIGTPKGMNDFYQLYSKAKTNDKWFSTLLTVEDTGILDKEELADAQEVMDADEFNQEFYCSFEASLKGAYYANQLEKARNSGRITRIPYDANLPVYTFWDLGISDSMTIWFMQIVGQEYRFIDYYENEGESLQHYIQICQQKGYIYDSHYAPHDIEVRELTTGVTRWETAQKLGITFKIVPRTPSLADGIQATRAIFHKCWFDKDNCFQGLNSLMSYKKRWNDKMQIFSDTPQHDWASHGCTVAGTQIKMKNGYKNIEDILVGDIVDIHGVYGEVTHSGYVKDSLTIKIGLTDGTEIQTSPEHKFFTTRGIVCADELVYNDSIHTLTKPIWNVKKFQKEGIRKGVISYMEGQDITIGKQEDFTCRKKEGKQNFFIEFCGKIGLVKLLEKMRFIRLMGIGRISKKIIGEKERRVQTEKCLVNIRSKNIKEKNITKENQMDTIVASIQTVSCIGLFGVMLMEKYRKVIISIIRTAIRVTMLLKTLRVFPLQTILNYMQKRISGLEAKQTRSNYEKQGNDQQNYARVVNLSTGNLCPVYDITVSHHHCYLANGLLVSNSDAFRQFAQISSRLNATSETGNRDQLDYFEETRTKAKNRFT